MDFSKLFEWIKLQPRYLTPILIATGTLLFSPARFIEKLGLQKFQGEYKTWVGIVFLLTLSLLLSHSAVLGWHFLRRKSQAKEALQDLQKRLHSLSGPEKEILRGYLAKNTKSQILDFADGVANGLQAAKIIFRSSSLGSLYGFAYNIQPWAWEYLHDNPQLLE